MLLDASVHPYGSFWLDVADKAIKGIAVLVGGAWTYSNFLRARTFRPRIECTVSGQIFRKNGQAYALVSCVLKNAGQSKYVISQKGTYLEPIALTPAGRVKLPGAEVFSEHAWIEPGEQIVDPVVLAIPDPTDFVAVRLNLRVVSEGIEWNASCVLPDTEAQEVQNGLDVAAENRVTGTH